VSSLVDDVLAAHGVHVRPLHQVISLLRTDWRDLGELIRVSAAPRRSVEDVLNALGEDLERDESRFRLAPAAREKYARFGASARETDPDLLKTITRYIENVPAPLSALDHVQATPETVLKRALWLDEQYDLGMGGGPEGQGGGKSAAKLLFLGDHDLTSLAVRALRPDADLTVVDLDDRVLAYIDELSERSIRTLHTDLRVGLPPSVTGRMDLVFSDPPYTPEGMGLFAARGVQALREPSDGRLLLAYGYSPRHPALGAQVQRSLATLGLTFEAILPGFHRYFGAQAIGSAADMYVCQPTAKSKKVRASKGKAGIYTHGPQSVESSTGKAKPALLDKLYEIASEGGLAVESRPVDWSVSGPEGDAVAMDLSADPGPWLLRTLLGTNARRLALLVPNSHPDLGNAEAQKALNDLVGAKYRLRLLRSTPDNRHAVVIADAVEHPDELRTRAHARLANVSLDVPSDLTDARLIDLPRHRLTELLA
jgi:predicted methyltransferase